MQRAEQNGYKENNARWNKTGSDDIRESQKLCIAFRVGLHAASRHRCEVKRLR
jgi:hypothetical protein